MSPQGSEVRQYRKPPVVVEAVQLRVDTIAEAPNMTALDRFLVGVAVLLAVIDLTFWLGVWVLLASLFLVGAFLIGGVVDSAIELREYERRDREWRDRR